MSDDGIDRDAAAYLAFLDAQKPTAKDKGTGVRGYCMGGPLAFRTAAIASGRIRAVATFHGGGLVYDQTTAERAWHELGTLYSATLVSG